MDWSFKSFSLIKSWVQNRVCTAGKNIESMTTLFHIGCVWILEFRFGFEFKSDGFEMP